MVFFIDFKIIMFEACSTCIHSIHRNCQPVSTGVDLTCWNGGTSKCDSDKSKECWRMSSLTQIWLVGNVMMQPATCEANIPGQQLTFRKLARKQDVKHTLWLLQDISFVQHRPIVLFAGFKCISWTQHEQIENNKKNWLRTSLTDETMSALTILATERDIMLQINNDYN